MDDERFDRFTRSLQGRLSRRGLAGLLGGLSLGGTLALRNLDDTAAKKKRTRRKRRRISPRRPRPRRPRPRRPPPPPRPPPPGRRQRRDLHCVSLPTINAGPGRRAGHLPAAGNGRQSGGLHLHQQHGGECLHHLHPVWSRYPLRDSGGGLELPRSYSVIARRPPPWR